MVAEKALELGPEKTHSWLAERDPEAAKRLNVQDQQRVCRALEKTFSSEEPTPSYGPLGKDNVLFLGLERSRENLDKILRTRTDHMWKSGLLDETKKLFEMGIPAGHPIWTAIGYAEAAAYLKKEMSEADALERIFRRTRQYAKRQWTWFKHQHEVQWMDLDAFSDVDTAVLELEKRIKA
jgi:tRNA dimethylallyltransferase